MKCIILLLIIIAASFFSSSRLESIPGLAKFSTAEPDMILVEGGNFQMGNESGERDERPAHTVTLGSFYLAKYEVTQKDWASVMGENPSSFKGCMDCPVEQVSPDMIQQFITKLNSQTGKNYRLPTEAEWEYAAAGGNKSKGYKYSGSNELLEVAWCKFNADEKTHPVGHKKSNELGIYDMSGNVWELCRDFYDRNYYKGCELINPVNDKPNLFRVVRGGSWRSEGNRCYCKARNRNVYDHHKGNGGFRLALSN